MSITFINYPKSKQQQTRQKSGAYIFYPSREGTIYYSSDKPLMIRIIRGMLYSEISVKMRALEHRQETGFYLMVSFISQ